MRKKLVLVLTLMCAVAAFVGCGKEEVPQQEVSYNMTFINETGEGASALKIRPTEDDDWTDNMLQESEWKNGFSVPVTLNGLVPIVENGWQVQMTFTDGTEQVWENVVLEDGDTITFTLEDGTPSVTHMPAEDVTNDTEDVLDDSDVQNQLDDESFQEDSLTEE